MAAQTVSAFAVDQWLQTNLLHKGVLFHLMIFLFNYDYTLDEGGVETSDESNQQEVANNLARLSIEAVARLGGYQCECVRVCVGGCGMCVCGGGGEGGVCVCGVRMRMWDVCGGRGCTVFLAYTIYCVVYLFSIPLAVYVYNPCLHHPLQLAVRLTPLLRTQTSRRCWCLCSLPTSPEISPSYPQTRYSRPAPCTLTYSAYLYVYI